MSGTTKDSNYQLISLDVEKEKKSSVKIVLFTNKNYSRNKIFKRNSASPSCPESLRLRILQATIVSNNIPPIYLPTICLSSHRGRGKGQVLGGTSSARHSTAFYYALFIQAESLAAHAQRLQTPIPSQQPIDQPNEGKLEQTFVCTDEKTGLFKLYTIGSHLNTWRPLVLT